MKPLAYFLLFMLFLLQLSCSKNDLTEATILQYDYTKCLCCGGLIVQIDEETFQCFNYPASLSPDVKKDYPFKVNIKFIKYDTNYDKPCYTRDGLIDIQEAEF